MPGHETLIAVLPWLAVLGPFAGLALVYGVIPRVFALLGSRTFAALLTVAAIVYVLLEVRP